MNLQLPAELNAFIAQLVADGRYESENAAISHAIRLLMSHEKLRAEVEEGFRQVERGEWVDADEAVDELLEKINAMAARQPSGESNAAG